MTTYIKYGASQFPFLSFFSFFFSLTMQPPFALLPATCELCGDWLPDHQSNCPRKGVHPSQWTATMLIEDDDSDSDLLSLMDHDD
ncbi:hypothetical protein BJV82DRAFT_597305 [Fennellomyces sp. T-0311]|nr:hypothetical protein BJV82DRAFT_597305 [Fennellomyces sp. T-0311]